MRSREWTRSQKSCYLEPHFTEGVKRLVNTTPSPASNGSAVRIGRVQSLSRTYFDAPKIELKKVI